MRIRFTSKYNALYVKTENYVRLKKIEQSGFGLKRNDTTKK